MAGHVTELVADSWIAKPCGRSSRSTRRSTPPGLPSAAAGTGWSVRSTHAQAARTRARTALMLTSHLGPGVEAEAHLRLEHLEGMRVDRLDLLRHGRREPDVVAVVDAASDDREEHAVLVVHVAEAAIDPGRAREGVPLPEHDLLSAVVVEGELELAFQHDEGLERLHMRVQAGSLPRRHDGDEHGQARRVVDRGVV